jgi:hypothetical protein
MDWVDVGQGKDQWRALVNTVMDIGKLLSGCIADGFLRRAQLHGVSY